MLYKFKSEKERVIDNSSHQSQAQINCWSHKGLIIEREKDICSYLIISECDFILRWNDVESCRRISSFWLVCEKSIIHKKKVGSKLGLFGIFLLGANFSDWSKMYKYLFQFSFLLGCAIPLRKSLNFVIWLLFVVVGTSGYTTSL